MTNRSRADHFSSLIGVGTRNPRMHWQELPISGRTIERESQSAADEIPPDWEGPAFDIYSNRLFLRIQGEAQASKTVLPDKFEI